MMLMYVHIAWFIIFCSPLLFCSHSKWSNVPHLAALQADSVVLFYWNWKVEQNVTQSSEKDHLHSLLSMMKDIFLIFMQIGVFHFNAVPRQMNTCTQNGIADTDNGPFNNVCVLCCAVHEWQKYGMPVLRIHWNVDAAAGARQLTTTTTNSKQHQLYV